jgi:predicted dehydrogenase
VLLEASKTAHCPAFNHLIALVKSGVIGDVIDVRASLSKLTQGSLRELDATQAGGSMTELAPFPLLSIIKLLGKNYRDIQFYSKMENGVDIFTKGIINYDHAVSTITLGLGVKTEGNLVISGTKGYVYVPAPWWLTDFFEVRYENQTLNKKYFYSYDGEGLRYEIQEFASMVFNHRLSSYHLRRRESCTIAGIIEKFLNRENFREI